MNRDNGRSIVEIVKCFIFVSLIAFHFSASAQVTFEGCRDIYGVPVASIPDYSVQDIAIAMIAPGGAPIIRFNPTVLMSVAPQTRVFFYMHECGHHALGHNFGTTHPLMREQAADCFGIRTLVERGMVNDTDIRVIQADLYARSRGDWTHLPGLPRAINLQACLSDIRRSGDPTSGTSTSDSQESTPNEAPIANSSEAPSCPSETTANGYISERCEGITTRLE